MIAPTVDVIWAALIGYFLGSIPFSYVIVKIFLRIDIRTIGSKNVGGRNVIRSFKHEEKPDGLAYSMGLLAAILDIGKGYFAMWLAQYLTTFAHSDPWTIGFASAFAILGHCWPVWLRSHGGRGVATTLGNMIFYNPLFLPIWLVLFFLLSIPLMYSAIVYLSSFLVMGIILYFWAYTDFYVSPAGNFMRQFTSDQTMGFVAMFAMFAITLIIITRQKANFLKIKSGEANRMKLWKIFKGKADEALK
ncbi:MAG: glycerol-3-phosphate acyltransferase [Candidatus Heimdallarchaeaceae archaeon]|jgi:glycerol-3-phosphate acyltransferase PlsY